MVKLFLRDNTSGRIHEYGSNQHDSLILQEDGSIHYHNMQNSTGTKFPEEGYTFVLEDGTDPRTGEDYREHGVEPYLDIGGCKATTLEHIMRIDFETIDGEMVALFDDRNETEESVGKYLDEAYPFIQHRNIVVMYKQQFENVFRVDDQLKAELDKDIKQIVEE